MVFQIRPITLREQIVEEIQRAILEGRLHPGDRIRERDLTKQLNVSRTPIREALIVLEREGLVDSYPNRGSFVRDFDEQDIVEIFDVRTALESLAGEILIRRGGPTTPEHQHLSDLIRQQQEALDQQTGRAGALDLQFHHDLVKMSGNSRLIRAWHTNRAQVSAVIYYHITTKVDYDEYQMIRDHQRLLAALLNGQVARLAEANRQVNDQIARHCIQGLRIREHNAKP